MFMCNKRTAASFCTPDFLLTAIVQVSVRFIKPSAEVHCGKVWRNLNIVMYIVF